MPTTFGITKIFMSLFHEDTTQEICFFVNLHNIFNVVPSMYLHYISAFDGKQELIFFDYLSQFNHVLYKNHLHFKEKSEI